MKIHSLPFSHRRRRRGIHVFVNEALVRLNERKKKKNERKIIKVSPTVLGGGNQFLFQFPVVSIESSVQQFLSNPL